MPGWEIIGEEERRAVNEVFDNGAVLFRQSFAGLRNNIYKVKEFEAAFAKHLDQNVIQPSIVVDHQDTLARRFSSRHRMCVIVTHFEEVAIH